MNIFSFSSGEIDKIMKNKLKENTAEEILTKLIEYGYKKGDKMWCPYICKRTKEITRVTRDEYGNETGTVRVYENELMECSKDCMANKNGNCVFNGGEKSEDM